MAVSSSIAYAGPDKPAAHRSAAAMVFVGRSGFSTCGKIENSTSPSASSPPSGGVQRTKSSPILGVITMLPPLSPTQTVSSDGKRSASPDCRIQWHRYNESPPFTSRASVSVTRGTQSSSSMLGNAVSSSTPMDFQPNSIIGQRGSCPLMKFHALGGPAMGCPYEAVGMQRALDSAIGLPRSSTSASWMLGFLMPADVRRNFMPLPGVVVAGVNVLAAYGSTRRRDWLTIENSSAPATTSLTSSGVIPEQWPSERKVSQALHQVHESVVDLKRLPAEDDDSRHSDGVGRRFYVAELRVQTPRRLIAFLTNTQADRLPASGPRLSLCRSRELGRDPLSAPLRQDEHVLNLRNAQVRPRPRDVRVTDRFS